MSHEKLINTYCAAWSEPDPEQRRELLSRVWAEGATYTDPTVHAVGLDSLLDHIDAVLSRRPGAAVLRTSAIDVHHEVARFAWHVVLADGTALPEGLDLVEFAEDGRIRRIVGFFGPLGPLDHP
ncbi:nuclear transport factor 2 family protein [Nocardia sp. NPDC051832]|uniref:nuclear transport factor 2 family protein n=1 Tax=Nocardia sp. NPDC051832 TaxID=3155673 RepID=UPI0034284A1C